MQNVPTKAQVRLDEFISTEVIMDGRILSENLRRMGLDKVWLMRALKEQGCKSAKDVFLGLCDSNNKLTIFVNE